MNSPGPADAGPTRGLSPVLLLGVGVAVVTVLIIGFFAVGGRSMLEQARVSPPTPEVGDCIASRMDQTIRDCDDSRARLLVVGVFDIPAEGATRQTCMDVVGSFSTLIYTTNNSGKALCAYDRTSESEPDPAPETSTGEAPRGDELPGLGLSVGDCIGGDGGDERDVRDGGQALHQVSCGSPGSRMVLAEVSHPSECENVEGTTSPIYALGAEAGAPVYCIGEDTA